MFKVSNELIEKLKKNTTPNYALSDEEFALLESVGRENREFTTDDIFPRWFSDSCEKFKRESPYIHRIKSGYVPPQPELPKLEVGQVYVLVKHNEKKWLFGIFRGAYAGRLGFEPTCGKANFNVDPAKWTFHKIVTEEVGK